MPSDVADETRPFAVTAADAGRRAADLGRTAGVEGRMAGCCVDGAAGSQLAGIICEATSRLDFAVAGRNVAAVAGLASADGRAVIGRADAARPDCARADAGRAVAGRGVAGGDGSGVEGGDGHESQCQSFLLVLVFCLRTLCGLNFG